ncbi:hypothetical protein J2W55_000001, partial [Mucilaginibacter pocheonensis]|nr:hypothetical protein [Mucilaginibacter pocheonensis]
AQYEFDGHAYQLQTIQGVMGKTGNGSLYRIRPKGQRIVLALTDY